MRIKTSMTRRFRPAAGRVRVRRGGPPGIAAEPTGCGTSSLPAWWVRSRMESAGSRPGNVRIRHRDFFPAMGDARHAAPPSWPRLNGRRALAFWVRKDHCGRNREGKPAISVFNGTISTTVITENTTVRFLASTHWLPPGPGIPLTAVAPDSSPAGPKVTSRSRVDPMSQ